MKALINYIFLTEPILSLARDLKGTLILNDGEDYYLSFGVLKQCLKDTNNMEACVKFLCNLIYAITKGQVHMNVLNEDGYIVATMDWNQEKQIYEQLEYIPF